MAPVLAVHFQHARSFSLHHFFPLLLTMPHHFMSKSFLYFCTLISCCFHPMTLLEDFLSIFPLGVGECIEWQMLGRRWWGWRIEKEEEKVWKQKGQLWIKWGKWRCINEQNSEQQHRRKREVLLLPIISENWNWYEIKNKKPIIFIISKKIKTGSFSKM